MRTTPFSMTYHPGQIPYLKRCPGNQLLMRVMAGVRWSIPDQPISLEPAVNVGRRISDARARAAVVETVRDLLANVILAGYRNTWLLPEKSREPWLAAEEETARAGLGASTVAQERSVLRATIAQVRERLAVWKLDLPPAAPSRARDSVAADVRGPYSRRRGSSESRRPSPSRLNASTTNAIASPGTMAT